MFNKKLKPLGKYYEVCKHGARNLFRVRTYSYVWVVCYLGYYANSVATQRNGPYDTSSKFSSSPFCRFLSLSLCSSTSFLARATAAVATLLTSFYFVTKHLKITTTVKHRAMAGPTVRTARKRSPFSASFPGTRHPLRAFSPPPTTTGRVRGRPSVPSLRASIFIGVGLMATPSPSIFTP